MEGVWLRGGIVMPAGVAEGIGTVPGFVNVHGIIVCGILDVDIGKPENLRFHQGAAVGCAVEFYKSADLWICRASRYPGGGGRGVVVQKFG